MEYLKMVATAAGYSEPKSVPEIIGAFIALALSFVGLIFLILMIYGGFIWMTAGGNDMKVIKAKKIIVQATIGVIIVLSAYAITTFVLQALTQAIG